MEGSESFKKPNCQFHWSEGGEVGCSTNAVVYSLRTPGALNELQTKYCLGNPALCAS